MCRFINTLHRIAVNAPNLVNLGSFSLDLKRTSIIYLLLNQTRLGGTFFGFLHCFEKNANFNLFKLNVKIVILIIFIFIFTSYDRKLNFDQTLSLQNSQFLMCLQVELLHHQLVMKIRKSKTKFFVLFLSKINK